MSTYAIGDVQGCFSPLQKLLEKIQFDPAKDSLWFTGDLVNRGPHSLETLRFIKQLGENHFTVLGNHDLHLLALANGARKNRDDDTLLPILNAPDRDELLNWLQHRPLLHYDKKLNFVMTHAGIAPSWDLPTAQALAKEVETILQSDQHVDFFHNMYGNEPALWNPELTGWNRLRCITNYFTRMRFCHIDGSLELQTKENMNIENTNLIPWFQIPNRVNKNLNIIFGHWAALSGVTNTPNVFALDTGCVWGFCLTAMRLENQQRISVDCGA